MRTHRITGVFGGLLLLALAGAAGAEQERQKQHSPHHQTRGMIERLHNREDRGRDHVSDQRRARNEWRGHHDGDRGHGRHHNHDRHDRRHDGGRHHHDRDRERHPHWGHESRRGRGYWHDYHHGQRRHHHAYRHRFYNNYHYYFNSTGFYFPGYGFISHGHAHGRHCPHWHFEDFAAGFVLGAIIID